MSKDNDIFQEKKRHLFLRIQFIEWVIMYTTRRDYWITPCSQYKMRMRKTELKGKHTQKYIFHPKERPNRALPFAENFTKIEQSV